MSSVDLKVRARKAMKRRKINQEELAVIAGVSPSQLSQILSRKSKPSIDVAARIEKAIGIPARDFAEVT